MFMVLFVFVVVSLFAFVCVYVLDWWSSGNGFHRTLLAEQWCCPMWNEIRFHFVWKSSNIHQTGHITWILPRSPGPTWPWSWWPPQQPPPRPTPDCSKPTRGQPSSLSHRFIWKRSRPMRMRTNSEPYSQYPLFCGHPEIFQVTFRGKTRLGFMCVAGRWCLWAPSCE